EPINDRRRKWWHYASTYSGCRIDLLNRSPLSLNSRLECCDACIVQVEAERAVGSQAVVGIIELVDRKISEREASEVHGDLAPGFAHQAQALMFAPSVHLGGLSLRVMIPIPSAFSHKLSLCDSLLLMHCLWS